jgi:uncharacterized membrane protein
MTREDAVRRLFWLWAGMVVLPLIIVAAQTVAGKYGEDSDLAWSWLMTQFVPALSLLLAAVFTQASTRWRTASANPFRWRCALWGSLLQGACLFAILLVEPLIAATPFELFSNTAPGLALLQGCCVAAIGSVVFDGR